MNKCHAPYLLPINLDYYRMGGVCGSEIREGGQILLGASDQLPENGMAEFQVEENKILVIK